MSTKKSIQNKKNVLASGSKKPALKSKKSTSTTTTITTTTNPTTIESPNTTTVIATKGIKARVVDATESNDSTTGSTLSFKVGLALTSDGCLAKPILKKKVAKAAAASAKDKKKLSEQKQEKKNVVFQLERNQTQLFNKLNNVSEIKPGLPVAQAIKLAPPTPKVVETIPTTTTTTTTTNTNDANESVITDTEQQQQQQQQTSIATTTIPTTSNKKNKKVAANKAQPTEEQQQQPKETQIQTKSEEQPQPKSKKRNNSNNNNSNTTTSDNSKAVEEEASVVPEMKDVKKSKNNNNNNNSKQQQKEVAVVATQATNEKKEEKKEEKVVVETTAIEVKEDKKKEKKKERDVISGFNVLPVKIPGTSITKYIYYKKETSKKWPVNKTLFVTNLPHNCSSLLDLQVLFQSTDIESVQYGGAAAAADQQIVPESESSSTTVAHVIMKSAQSLTDLLKYLNIIDIKLPTSTSDGLDEMLNEEKSKIIKDFDELQIKLDDAMMEHDKRMLLERHNRKDMQGVPDEDGFILVTGNNKTYKPITQEEYKKKEDAKKQKNFYSFQQRQQKKQELDNLRKKFEEDKQKIAKMSANRKFKPY